MSFVKSLWEKPVAWVKAHPATVKHDLAMFGALLAAQPAIHAWLGGEHVAASVLIGAAAVAARNAARKVLTGQ